MLPVNTSNPSGFSNFYEDVNTSRTLFEEHIYAHSDMQQKRQYQLRDNAGHQERLIADCYYRGSVCWGCTQFDGRLR